jgi:hypothetical protein
MGMSDATFPVYLRAKGDKEIREFHSLEHLRSWVEAIDVENDEYEGWDSQGSQVTLQLQEGNSVTAKSMEETAAKEEVLRAFNDFATAEGVSFEKPPQPYDLPKTYAYLRTAVEEARNRKPWWRRALRRL